MKPTVPDAHFNVIKWSIWSNKKHLDGFRGHEGVWWAKPKGQKPYSPEESGPKENQLAIHSFFRSWGAGVLLEFREKRMADFRLRPPATSKKRRKLWNSRANRNRIQSNQRREDRNVRTQQANLGENQPEHDWKKRAEK